MSSKYLFLVGSQFSTQDKEKLAALEQASCMNIEEEQEPNHLSKHEADSHISIDGKIFVCLDAILGKKNCSFCIINTFNRLMHSKIDGQQNLHLSFKRANNESQCQNINYFMQSLSANPSSQTQIIQGLIEQVLSRKQTKDFSDEVSSHFSLSTNTSIPKCYNPQIQKSPFLSMSWENNNMNNESIQIQISSQLLQILDWDPEDLQMEIHSIGLLEFTTGFNLNEPLMWLLGQFSSNNIYDQNYYSESPLFAQQYLNSKKQNINALVQYEIMNTPQRFYLTIYIKQVESTLGRRYPTRQTKDSGKMNVQLQTQQNISIYFNQSSQIKQDDLITQQNRVLSFEEIQFIEKYYQSNLEQSHPQLVKHNQKQCLYRQI